MQQLQRPQPQSTPLHYTALRDHYHSTTTPLPLQIQVPRKYNYNYNYIALPPTTFQSIGGFALPSIIHRNQPLLYVSYLETSATALCGTYWYYNHNHMVWVNLITASLRQNNENQGFYRDIIPFYGRTIQVGKIL